MKNTLVFVLMLSISPSLAVAAGGRGSKCQDYLNLPGRAFSKTVGQIGQQAYLLLPVSVERLTELANVGNPGQSLIGFRLIEKPTNDHVNHLIPVPKTIIGKPLTELMLLSSLSKTPTILKLGKKHINALNLNLYPKDFAYFIVDLSAMDNSTWLLVHHLQLKFDEPNAYSGINEADKEIIYDSFASPDEIAELFADMERNLALYKENRTPVAIVRPGPLNASQVKGLILPSHVEMNLTKGELEVLNKAFSVFQTDNFPSLK